MSLRDGFTLGDRTVYPLEGRVVGADGEQRITPKTMDVLLYLAENAGAVVEREDALRHVWGERAQTDEPLTRCIGELRRALKDTRGEPEYILTVPKRGYRLLKSPVPLVGTEGLPDAPPPAPQERQRLGTMKKIGIGALLLVAAAILEVVVERALDNAQHQLGDSHSTSAVTQAGNSIAVLPFSNFSEDKSQEYFSDGISEELLNLLSRNPELRVISRTSAFSYKGSNLDLPTIAAQLNVAYVLEGSVRRSGETVRITAQLIDARSDSHLWSETYDRTLDNIFAIQDEIAATVASRLEVTLLGESPRARTTDPEAYSLFLRGRDIGRRVTPEGFAAAIALYEQALEIDPEYSNAWVALAGIYINMATNSDMPLDEGFELARDTAEKALAVDPDNATGYAHLGWISMWYDRDLRAAADYYERALTLAPSDLAIIGNAAILLKGLGHLDQAIALTEYQAARDPVNPTAHYNLGLLYIAAGRWDEAIESFDTTLQLSPGYYAANSFIGTALLLRGDTKLALEAMQGEPSEAYRWLGLVMAHHANGENEASDAVLADMIEKYEQQWAYNIAYVLAYRNDVDEAFDWLDKAVEYGDPGLADVVAEILFTNLHDDPRWTDFLQRIGRSPQQLDSIEFTVARPD